MINYDVRFRTLVPDDDCQTAIKIGPCGNESRAKAGSQLLVRQRCCSSQSSLFYMYSSKNILLRDRTR